eukprot:1482500-Rhodomonas_salina.4
MQLLLPNAKIWLDVDSLDDVGALEASVRDSAVFVILLSQGYFHSANSRRELYRDCPGCWQADSCRRRDGGGRE